VYYLILKLTQRPAQLQIHPTENYHLTERLTDEKNSEEPVIIQDMPEMAKLVYEMYMKEMESVRILEVSNVTVKSNAKLLVLKRRIRKFFNIYIFFQFMIEFR